MKKKKLVPLSVKGADLELTQKQKQKYALARQNNDFVGMRLANVEANKLREKAKLPLYSSAVGDKQHSLNTVKKVGNLKPYLGAQHIAPKLPRKKQSVSEQMFDKKETYVDKAKKGDLKGAALNFVGSGIQGAQSFYLNTLNNADSIITGKGLQPFKYNMDFTDYENASAKRHNTKTVTEVISKNHPKLGAAYNIGMNIATDPVNLLDGAGMLKAKGLKTLGSTDYSKDLLKGGKTFIPTVKKETTPVLGANGKLKNIKTIKPINNTSGFLGQVGDKFEVNRPLATTPIPQALKQGIEYNMHLKGTSGKDYIVAKSEKISKSISGDGTVVLSENPLNNVDPKDYRDYVKRFAEGNYMTHYDNKGNMTLFRPITIKSDGRQVIITKSGLNDVAKKMRSGAKSEEYAKSMLVLDKILENVTKVGELPNLKGRENPFSYYSGTFDSGKGKYKVEVTVKDTPSIGRYYYHNLNDVGEAQIKIEPLLDGAYTLKGDRNLIEQGSINSILQQPQKNVNQFMDLGSDLSQTEKTTPKLPYNPFAKPKFKDLGADVNKFPQEMKVSQFKTNTMRNSIFSEAEKSIDDAIYEYEAVSEKQSLKEAKQRLQTDFDGEVKDLSTKKDFDGVDLDTSMGIAEQYLKEAEQTGNYKNFLNWTKNIQEKGTQSGQMIQAFAKYSRTPEGAAIKGQQTVNRVIKELAKDNPKLFETVNEETKEILRKALNGEFEKIKGSKKFVEDIRKLAKEEKINKETVEELVKGKYDIPTLSNDDVKAITENMKLGQDATDPYMKEMYFEKAEQIISDKVPAELREKFRASQRLSLILNPKTLIARNPLGNVILGTTENIKDIPGSMADRIVSLKTGQRTTTGLTMQKLTDQATGMRKGLSDWGKDVKYGVDTSPSRGKYELPNKRIFKGELLNKLDMFERHALQLGDRPFYQAAYNSRIGELKKLGVTGEEAEKQAKLYALDRVFQNNSNLSKAASAIRDNMNKMTGDFPFGDLSVPFTQTPANILDKLIDYSPAGLTRAVKEWGNLSKGTFDQKHFVDLIGRTFTGAGIAILGYALAEKGIITSDLYGTNKDLYKAQQMAGKKSYAFKIDGKYYTFDWASPIGNILAAAAEFQKSAADKDDLIDALGAGSKAAADTVFSQSFLSGVLDMLSGYSPASGIAKSLLGSTTQLTPTMGANIARTIDPYMRETYDPSKLTQTKNKLVARIPFASKTLPKRLGTDGNPIMQNQGRGIGSRAVENFLTPYNLGVRNFDKVNDETLRLQSATGNNSVLLNSADKYVEFGGQKTELSTEQYQEYQKLIGKEAYSQISRLMDTTQYKNMADVQKAEAIQKINDDVRANAKKKILVETGQDAKTVWLKDLGKQATSGYDTMKVAPEDYYKTYRGMLDKTNEVGSDANIYKALALSEMGADEGYYDAFGVTSNSTDFRALANNFNQNNITAEDYYEYRLQADLDSNNSIKKAEAVHMLEQESLTREQKRVLFAALCPTVKYNPY